MIQRVLVGLDFSTHSDAVLAWAADLARRLGVPLEAMHVVEVPYPSYFPTQATLGDPAWFREHQAKVLATLTEHLAPYPEAKGTVRQGNPAEQLIFAAEPGTLLVVGDVGHSRLHHLLAGGTTSQVVRHALGDVAVVRTKRPG